MTHKRQKFIKVWAAILLSLLLVVGVVPMAVLAQPAPKDADALCTHQHEDTCPEGEKCPHAQNECTPQQPCKVPATPSADADRATSKSVETDLPESASAKAPGEGTPSPLVRQAKAPQSPSKKGSIGGLLWLDSNDNGQREEGEASISDYPLALYAPENPDSIVATAKTGKNGSYSFPDLADGSYVVQVKPNEQGTDKYLLPLAPVSESSDNRFALHEASSGSVSALSADIVLQEAAQIDNLHAGLRAPLAIAPAASTEVEVSDHATLAAAVTRSNSGEDIVLVLTQSIAMNATLVVSDDLTLRSKNGGGYRLTMATADTRHFVWNSSGGNFTIDFSGVALDGGGTGGGVEVKGSNRSTMTGGTIQNCSNADGGGLEIFNAFTLSGGSIQGNTASHSGGGVSVNRSGNFTMEGTASISGNTSDFAGGVSVSGGTVQLKSGSIFGNTSDTYGGGLSVINDATGTLSGSIKIYGNTAKFGGGVCIYPNSSVSVSGNTEISNNTATVPDRPGGGGIYATGILVMGGNAKVNGNTSISGGGIYSSGSFTLGDKVSITHNKATGGSGGGVFFKGLAAATAFEIGGEASITDNQAVAYGGGIHATGGALSLSGSALISRNTATLGGGIHAQNSDSVSSFSMSGGSISHNTASNGGGVYLYDNASLNLSNGSIANNAANGTPYSGHGGGVYAASYSTLDVSGGAQLAQNTASANGGGVYVDNSAVRIGGGTISENSALQGGGVYLLNTILSTMSGGALTGNTATGGTGGNAFGGGVFVHVGKFEMSGGTIGGGGATAPNHAKNGAGVYINSATFELSGSAHILGNRAETQGGGIYVTSAGSWTMNGGHVGGAGNGEANQAATGGGVYTSGVSTINGGTISGNNASRNGGGVYSLETNDLKVNGGTITQNTALHGGGIFAWECSKLLVESGATIKDNTATAGEFVLNPALDSAMHATYQSNIKLSSGNFSAGTAFALNNRDIGYTKVVLNFMMKPGEEGWATISGASNTPPSKLSLVRYGQAWAALSSHIPSIAPNQDYTFLGWSLSGSNESINPLYLVKGNTVIQANMHSNKSPLFTVTFDKNAGADAVTDMPDSMRNVTPGSKINAPGTAPARVGYTFGGWYKQAACTFAWGFDADTVSANLTLYARWTAAATPPPDPTEPPVTPPVDPTTPGVTPDVTPGVAQTGLGATTPTVISQDTQEQLDAQQDKDLVQVLQDGNVPLGGLRFSGAWSLLNLILTLVFSLVSLLSLVRWLIKRRKLHYDGEGAPITSRRHTTLVTVLRGAFCASGLVIALAFLILEDMTQPVVWVNANTLLFVILSVVNVLLFGSAWFVSHRRNKKERRMAGEMDGDVHSWLQEDGESH